MEYTIYHIEGIKVGCTKRDVTKRVKEQGYTNFEILGIYDNIKEAGIKERELQLKLGYGYDSNELYNDRYTTNGIKTGNKHIESGHIKTFVSEGGKVQGKINSDNGHIQQIQLQYSKQPKKSWEVLKNRNLEYKTCPYCGIVTRGRGYDRWHGEKCKHK